jgi:glycosyltransferase involved in cell wall biosynthesis
MCFAKSFQGLNCIYNPTMPTLAAIIITYNEASNLEDCLTSLQGLVQQIVVLDSGSTDATLQIAHRFGAIVKSTTQWCGFGHQKNLALDLATTDWVLSIDADERLSPELAHEIQSVLTRPNPAQCYAMPRLSWYCGRFIRHSGWYPDFVERLFLRGTARFSDDLVHERLLYAGEAARLQHHLVHYSFRDFSQVLQKLDRYSTASAQQAFNRGKRATFASALSHGAWAFVRTYLLKAGFLDGAQGFALAVSNAEGTYYKYLKIWQLGMATQAASHPASQTAQQHDGQA